MLRKILQYRCNSIWRLVRNNLLFFPINRFCICQRISQLQHSLHSVFHPGFRPARTNSQTETENLRSNSTSDELKGLAGDRGLYPRKFKILCFSIVKRYKFPDLLLYGVKELPPGEKFLNSTLNSTQRRVTYFNSE